MESSWGDLPNTQEPLRAERGNKLCCDYIFQFRDGRGGFYRGLLTYLRLNCAGACWAAVIYVLYSDPHHDQLGWDFQKGPSVNRRYYPSGRQQLIYSPIYFHSPKVASKVSRKTCFSPAAPTNQKQHHLKDVPLLVAHHYLVLFAKQQAALVEK